MVKIIRALGTAVFLAVFLAGMTGCQTTPPQSNSKASKEAQEQGIILRAGDALSISFPGSPNLDNKQPIRRDGKIVLPLVGEVEAAGLTPEALKNKLVALYKPQLASSEIVVAVESSSFPVYVTGAVIHPGKINSDHPITALEAIMEAGGFEYNTANMKKVRVNRTESGEIKHYILDLKSELEGGNSSRPFYLKPNDIIFVPQRLQVF